MKAMNVIPAERACVGSPRAPCGALAPFARGAKESSAFVNPLVKGAGRVSGRRDPAQAGSAAMTSEA
jgi:hypothetical protein